VYVGVLYVWNVAYGMCVYMAERLQGVWMVCGECVCVCVCVCGGCMRSESACNACMCEECSLVVFVCVCGCGVRFCVDGACINSVSHAILQRNIHSAHTTTL